MNPFNLNEVEDIQGFDPKGLFSKNLLMVRYEDLFKRILEESGESHIGPSNEKKLPSHVEEANNKNRTNMRGRNKERSKKPIYPLSTSTP